MTGRADSDKYPYVFLLRFLFIFVILYIIFAVVRFIQAIGKPPGEPRRSPTLGGTMVKDHFCNMYLPREEAIREVRGGKEYFFCSRECRDGFFKKAEEASGRPEV